MRRHVQTELFREFIKGDENSRYQFSKKYDIYPIISHDNLSFLLIMDKKSGYLKEVTNKILENLSPSIKETRTLQLKTISIKRFHQSFFLSIQLKEFC